jgi:diguanylate cyclase (GGDEF)-like protein
MSGTAQPLILVVDDEPDILTLNRMVLEQAGYQVVTAGNGVDAIQKSIDFTPDVIVLDVMMPRMNGYQVCRLLKNDRRTAAIPIIICTVKSLKTEKLYAYTSGADEYLVKPFEKEKLVGLVRKSLKGREHRQGVSLQEGEVPRTRTSTDSILSDVNRLLDRRLMELTILQALTKTLSSTLALEDVLREIQQGLLGLGYANARILLLKEKGILVETTHSDAPLAVDSSKYPLLSKVVGRNEVFILEAEQADRTIPLDLQKVMHAQTVLLVPIHAKGRPIGLLIVENTPGQTLNRNQKEFLLTLASQAGLAIENANLYERTLQLSITDGLTEIYNYRFFRQRLEEEVARSKRYVSALGLLILDIDHFKNFNDRYGHLLGDEVLKNVARILKANTRDVDAVARYGGEEFAVLLNEIDLEEAIVYAERIREAVEGFMLALPDGSKAGVTVSLGVAVCQSGNLEEKEFIRRADQALYRAKEMGRNRVCVWQPEGDHLCQSEKSKEGS